MLPLLDAEAVAHLRHVYDDIVGDPPAGFSSVMFLEDSGFRRRCHDALVEALAEPCNRVLRGHVPYLASYVTKSGPGSALLPHQDWPLVDERVSTPTMRLWCPLEDVDETNGALYVSPGSHRLPYLLRAENLPSAVRLDTPVSEPMRCLRLRAGEAVIHDGRLVHSSPALAPGQSRLAVSVALIPEGAQAFHFRLDDEQRFVERFDVPVDFYFEHPMGAPVVGHEPVEHLVDEGPIIGPTDLQALVPGPARQRSWFRRLG